MPRQGILVRKGNRFQIESVFQIGPTQQAIRVSAKGQSLSRPLRRTGVMDAGGQGTHAYFITHRRSRFG